MIKNNKQMSAAQERLAALETELEEHIKRKGELRPFYYESRYNTHKEMIDKLKQEISSYNALQDGNVSFLVFKEFSELSDILISARILKRWSQKELAEKVGIQEQQIQRYEATDYQSAGWLRIVEVTKALGLRAEGNRVHLKNDNVVFLNPTSVNDSMKSEISRKLKNQQTFQLAGV